MVLSQDQDCKLNIPCFSFKVANHELSSRWSKVHPTLDIPLNGLFLSTIVCCLLGLIYFGSSAAFNSFTGVATICLSTSYAIPILISLLRGRKLVANSPFSLGKFGFAINAVTMVWIGLAVVLFCMPVSLPVEPPTMNYASVVFAGFTFISAVWYLVRGRKAFTGPPVAPDATEGAVIEIPAPDPEKE